MRLKPLKYETIIQEELFLIGIVEESNSYNGLAHSICKRDNIL